MKVVSISECFMSILQYFRPAFSDNRSWKSIFRLLFEWPLESGFTVFSYMVRNWVLNIISEHLSDKIPSQMNILYMLVPILMHKKYWVFFAKKQWKCTMLLLQLANEKQCNFMTALAAANFWCYPVGCHITIVSALEYWVTFRYTEVSKGAKIRNRYNKVPHLIEDTNGKVTNSQLYTTNESQEAIPFPAGDHKAQINRHAQRQDRKKNKRSTKEEPPWNGQ